MRSSPIASSPFPALVPPLAPRWSRRKALGSSHDRRSQLAPPAAFFELWAGSLLERVSQKCPVWDSDSSDDDEAEEPGEDNDPIPMEVDAAQVQPHPHFLFYFQNQKLNQMQHMILRLVQVWGLQQDLFFNRVTRFFGFRTNPFISPIDVLFRIMQSCNSDPLVLGPSSYLCFFLQFPSPPHHRYSAGQFGSLQSPLLFLTRTIKEAVGHGPSCFILVSKKSR